VIDFAAWLEVVPPFRGNHGENAGCDQKLLKGLNPSAHYH